MAPPPRTASGKTTSQLEREIAQFLAGRTIAADDPGEDLEDAGHWQQRRRNFRRASPRQVIDALGADHIAWILNQRDPARTADGKATGQWDANNLEMMSAYERLSDLIKQGRIR